ncbi:hypothetical protein ElyMa_003627600 [Elysia marginata]|uniref:Uncharacterized protein n=1 Tax=Elysia marginata TaxID=1093978 RepID=A0AAV4EV39_9GAST|nr:hypothetical protein ElyMa_003627600 [Elysia marginata]
MVEKERMTTGWRKWQHARTIALNRDEWRTRPYVPRGAKWIAGGPLHQVGAGANHLPVWYPRHSTHHDRAQQEDDVHVHKLLPHRSGRG